MYSPIQLALLCTGFWLSGFILGWSSRAFWMRRRFQRAAAESVLPGRLTDRGRLMRDLLVDLEEIRGLLAEAADYIQLERDAHYECVTTNDGVFDDPDDEQSIAETDELLTRARAALRYRPPTA